MVLGPGLQIEDPGLLEACRGRAEQTNEAVATIVASLADRHH